MESWEPITKQDLAALIMRQLDDCTAEQRDLFATYCVPMREAPIERFGKSESVLIVAQHGNTVIYYEDVEEGFNISLLASDGSIASPGCEQWTLCHAMSRFAA